MMGIYLLVGVLAVAMLAAGVYVVVVRNRFKVMENRIRGDSARVGATVQYVRSVDHQASGRSREAREHTQNLANKGVRRGPGKRFRPSFFVDFQPWPVARGVDVIIPALEAGLGTRGQDYQARLSLIEAIQVYNSELDKIPAGMVAQYFWQFRHWTYRFAQTGGGQGHGGRNRPRGQHNPRQRRPKGRWSP
jgi:hypothetical protein